MSTKRTYVAFGLVFAASLAAASFLPLKEALRGWFEVPALGALFAALLQIFRDRTAYQRSLFIAESQNSFSIGVMSHMASVAFDKYSSFCEEYVTEMFSALITLTREGPSVAAAHHGENLMAIRRKWAVWLTPAIEAQLAPFELAIRKIGGYAYGLQHTADGTEFQRDMYAMFAEVIGLDALGGQTTERRPDRCRDNRKTSLHFGD